MTNRAVLMAFPLSLTLIAVSISASGLSFAQEASQGQAEKEVAASEASDDSPAAEPQDPFAVPAEADVAELLDFIKQVQKERSNTLKTALKSARAVAEAAQAIRDFKDVDSEDEIKAIKYLLGAQSFMNRYDSKSRGKLKQLIEELKQDKRPEIVKLAKLEDFKSRAGSARQASKEEQLELIADLKTLLKGQEFDRNAYTLASGLARSIAYSENKELAASLYEELSGMMSAASDESVKSRASKMLGAARRLRLLGNTMEINGTTADGEDFDWSSYRGKVVLVDFWASWCGPCRAEVPNMKRHLELYGERGFEVVGINLDNTEKAYKRYVEKEEIPWVNLMSDKKGEKGWDNPIATYYGVSAIPTAILVNSEGKVVSLRARGKALDDLLLELLGEPEPASASEDESASVQETEAKETDSK